MRRSATLGAFLPGEGAVDAACAQNCRNGGFLSNNEFWSLLRNTNTTMTVFRAGFIFNPQPMGTTTHLPALEVLNGQVFLAVRGTDPNGGVWVNRWTGSSWAGWTNPDQGTTTNSPDMSVFNNSVHLVVAGTDLPNRGLWLNRYTSAWLGYIGMGTLFTSSQTCVSSSSLRIGDAGRMESVGGGRRRMWSPGQPWRSKTHVPRNAVAAQERFRCAHLLSCSHASFYPARTGVVYSVYSLLPCSI